ncbi:YcdB/YcdC domain-containing protein [Bacillus sp. FJAT-45350]|uniref:YcdB/YcdC domain-containing protein n=1 Tax=Bacillus sp. FJAT-45350 TaxID=2011014 RepID=UPI000BB80AB6|nr:YcdB/YcdC domain-containing protein [Bacillus sp. FJAT-45350]
MKYKRIGILSLSTMLSLGLVAPTISAADINQVRDQPEHKVMVSSLEVESVEKKDLIEKIRKLFPNKFDILTESDFHMDHHRYYGYDDDDTIRYNLHYNKRVGDNYVHGQFEFVGEDLEIQHMYTQPFDDKGALFPPKVNEDEAEKIAKDFLNKIANSSNYQLSDEPDYYNPPTNRPLTEAIEYRFHFERLQDGIPVLGQGIHITVLGNGEITNFSNSQYQSKPLQFEQIKNVLDDEKVLEKIKENLNLELKYKVDYDYYYGGEDVELSLVYVPSPSIEGVHAINGKWKIGPSFVDELPEPSEVKMLRDQASTNATPISRDAAKEKVESLLKPFVGENEQLRIHGVHEVDNQGMTLYDVNYMIESRTGGHGSSIAINKQTGDVIRFHNPTGYYRGNSDVKVNVSYQDALKKAVEKLNELSPSILHHYSYPTVDLKETGYGGVYNLSFPRVVNGIEVIGSNISVDISAEDGSLQSLYTNHPTLTNVPEISTAVDKEKAQEDFNRDLEVELTYMNDFRSENNQYHYLVYQGMFAKPYQFYDAVEGTWKNERYVEEGREAVEVTHSWAEEELNYLIKAGIIEIDNMEEFNPDESISKGEALKVLMKSLTRFYPHYPYEDRDDKRFENIDSSHPLYDITNRAVEIGILDTKTSTFDYESTLSRQELAIWYIRALGLENAAKHSDIYKLSFKDESEVEKEYRGYVALVSALEILNGSNNQFKPNGEVTMAQLAVSNLRMAQHTTNPQYRYY